MSSHSEQPPAQGQQEGALAAYVSAIRAHPVVVLLITLAAVGASVLFLTLRSPEYEATAELLVEPLPPEDQIFIGLPLLRDTGDPVRTMQTAASLVESQAAADLVAQRRGDDLTGEQLLEDRVDVSPEGTSNILAVTATADSAEAAALLANQFSRVALEVRADELARVAEDLIGDLEARLDATPRADQVARADLATRVDQIRSVLNRGDPTLLQSQPAIPPTSAAGASPALIVVLAILAGFTLGSGTALVLELMARRVRDEEEAIQLYPLPVLARVPALPARSRRGPRGSTWYMPPEIREPFRALAVQLEQRDHPPGAVMLTSPTTGDGKTTSVINLAVSLAATGKGVVVLDFDLRHPQIGSALGIEDGRRLSELVKTKASLRHLLVDASEPQLGSLRVLPVRFDPEDGDLNEAASRSLPQFIEQARSLANYVIVDTQPLGEVSDALRLARAVDDIVVVMRPGNTSRGHLKVMRELLERIGQTPEGCIIIGAAERSGRGYRS